MITHLAAACFGFLLGYLLCAILSLRDLHASHIRRGKGITKEVPSYAVIETRRRAEARDAGNGK